MKKVFFVLAVILCFTLPAAASKEGRVKKGNTFYQKGDYAASLKEYEQALKADPESPAINFNLGTALYKDGKFIDAVPALQKGLLSDDPLVKKNSHFNLGNAFYGQGLQMEKRKPDDAVEALEESLRQFETVLKLDDKDEDARYNHEIVKKKLEELKKKQEQKEQQKKGKGQGQEQKQNGGQGQQDKQEQSGSSEQKPSGGNEEKSEDQNGSSQQKKSEEDRSFSQEHDKDDKSGDPQDKGGPRPGEMTKEEAKMLLQQFEQNEQPAGLLTFPKGQAQERPVLKDW